MDPGPFPLWEPPAPATGICHGWHCVPWPVSLVLVSVTCRGHQGAPCPAPAMCQGHFPRAAVPMWGSPRRRGVSVPRHGLCPDHGAAEPIRVQAQALTGSPLSPGAAVSSREGRGKPPSVASELPGRVERCARWLLSLWPWLDLDLRSRRRRPLGSAGDGGGLSRTASPSAPRAGGERGLPKLLVLSSATRPARGRLLEPSPTSLKFLRPSKREKKKKKTETNPERHLLLSL